MNNNEQPRLFGLCAFALFALRWANLYQPQVHGQLIPKVWTHNWANFNYIRVAIYVYRWSFWFSICGNFVSWCRVRPALWPIALNSCLMIHCLLHLDGVYIRMEGAMTVGLRWLDIVFQGQYLPSLSVNCVAINKDLEKLTPQLY